MRGKPGRLGRLAHTLSCSRQEDNVGVGQYLLGRNGNLGYVVDKLPSISAVGSSTKSRCVDPDLERWESPPIDEGCQAGLRSANNGYTRGYDGYTRGDDVILVVMMIRLRF